MCAAHDAACGGPAIEIGGDGGATGAFKFGGTRAIGMGETAIAAIIFENRQSFDGRGVKTGMQPIRGFFLINFIKIMLNFPQLKTGWVEFLDRRNIGRLGGEREAGQER